MDRYAVMGNPIAHSKSPEIHTHFAQQTRQDLFYEKILVPEDGLDGAIRAFIESGGKGLNITVPFKEQAWRLVTRRSERAERAGAVNTIVIGPSGTFGDNTDGVGLVRDLHDNHGVVLADRRILLLGAGGAARGVLPTLLAATPAEIVVANRTEDRAHGLAEAFGDLGAIRGCGFDDLPGQRFQLVINATSAGIDGRLPPLPDDLLADGAACMDMFYASEPTAFVRWAMDHGAAKAVDGLGMLVEQAAEAFYLWRGVRPETAPVIEGLRQLE
ncbi:shikimate dehydrogenase [Ectothiorhodospiraceae bacterium WFHF3C12]|nr:shikimate dehydrogenase [Ectothiorhodospiraceae bacterium WFHF3C12]